MRNVCTHRVRKSTHSVRVVRTHSTHSVHIVPTHAHAHCAYECVRMYANFFVTANFQKKFVAIKFSAKKTRILQQSLEKNLPLPALLWRRLGKGPILGRELR